MTKKLSHASIKQLLNHSLTRLEQPTLARLRDIRVQALARYEARRTAPAFAWAGIGVGHAAATRHKPHFWPAAILFAALLFGVAPYWQHLAKHDTADLDIAILTDDLPIHVYVD